MRAPNNLHALRAFEATARHLSYVGAAAELNVTPGAVGHLVRSLEHMLSLPLFHRTSKANARLRLTEPARAVLADIQAGFDLLGASVERLKLGSARAVLAVTAPRSFTHKWLLRRLERFHEQRPDIDLQLEITDRLMDFDTERIDIGIRYGAGTWSGLRATQMLCDEFFPICSPALVKERPPICCPGDLRHYRLIHDTSMRSENAFPTWSSWLMKAGAVPNHTDSGLQCNDSAAVIQAVIAGYGVALGRSTLVAADLAAGHIIRPFGAAQSCGLAYYVVNKACADANNNVLAFKNWLMTELDPIN